MNQKLLSKIRKKTKDKQKKKLKNTIRNVTFNVSDGVNALKSQAEVVKRKFKEKTTYQYLADEENPALNTKRSHFSQHEELQEPDISPPIRIGCVMHNNESTNTDDLQNTELSQETLTADPLLIEMKCDAKSKFSPLKINGSNFKSLPSNLAFGFKSALFQSFFNSACSTQNCEVSYGSVEDTSQESEETLASVFQVPDIAENTSIRDSVLSLVETVSNVSNCAPIVEEKSKICYQSFRLAEDKMVVAVMHPCSLFFNGALCFKVLIGSVEVLGYEIGEDNRNKYKVFSPTGSSLLCFQAKYGNRENNWWKTAKKKLSSLGVPLDLSKRVFKDCPSLCSLILLERMDSSLPQFLDKYSTCRLFPASMQSYTKVNSSEACLYCEFISEESLHSIKCYNQMPDWDVLAASLSENKPGPVRIVMCGGKAVGKSTTLRFLVNRSLMKFQRVLYLDFDPGQCEFTIPGCVSAVLIDQPLLGPNYTHITKPHRMIYLGNVNVAQCSIFYLKCCEDILHFCQSQPEFSSIPWVINTMGFTKGIGVEIMVSIIKMVSPTDVVQIESSSRKRNYPALMVPTYVANFQSSIFRKFSSRGALLEYSFHCLHSAAERPGGGAKCPWGLEAYKLRDLVILSYFSSIVSKPTYSLLEAIPFTLSLSGLKLCVSHERIGYEYYLNAMNGNLVALCNAKGANALVPSDARYPKILQDTPICHCIGFGVVRGIDMEKQLIFITSPISEEERHVIDCLVLGAVHMPSCLYTSREHRAVGRIPYVVKGPQPLLGSKPRNTSSLVRPIL